MYSISGYGSMIADTVRMSAYRAALEAAVKPGSVVVDIGAGTGVFSLIACQLGARRVYAIEPSECIEVAREIAAANGFADRIECIQNMSTRVTLPELADVVVSDLRGVLPMFEAHIPSIADARRRLLKPGGALIPRRDTLWMSIAEAPQTYAEQAGCWRSCEGLDMEAARRIAVNRWIKKRLKPEDLLAAPWKWGELDYARIEETDIGGEARLTASRAGAAHGLLAWFDAEITEGIGFSNSPCAPKAIYGAAFFPWTEAVEIEPGDVIDASLRAILVNGDYSWRWTARVSRSGAARVEFDQSSFHGEVLSIDRLRKSGEGHVPALNEDGEIERFALALMDGAAPLGEIARRMAERFPERLRTRSEALNRAAQLSQRYSR